jgi:hypothetical protein
MEIAESQPHFFEQCGDFQFIPKLVFSEEARNHFGLRTSSYNVLLLSSGQIGIPAKALPSGNPVVAGMVIRNSSWALKHDVGQLDALRKNDGSAPQYNTH